MLVTYTHITALTPDQKQRLKAYLSHAVLEGHAIVQFEGMTLSVNELRAQQRIWEQERHQSRQVLLG